MDFRFIWLRKHLWFHKFWYELAQRWLKERNEAHQEITRLRHDLQYAYDWGVEDGANSLSIRISELEEGFSKIHDIAKHWFMLSNPQEQIMEITLPVMRSLNKSGGEDAIHPEAP